MVKNTLIKMKSKEREDRKDLIIDAAERVFSTKPFNKVGMREIAEEAGISPSSIYTYFPNQEALFVEATIRDSVLLIEAVTDIIEKTEEVAVLPDRVFETFLEFISTHDSYFRMMVVFMTVGSLNKDSLERLNEVVSRGFDVFEGVFRLMGYRGNTRILSHFFFSMLNGILVTFRKLEGRSEEEITEHMKRVAGVFSELLRDSISAKR